MDSQQIVTTLKDTQDGSKVLQATETLAQMEAHPGFGVALLEICATSQDQLVVLLAATKFKNFVMMKWVDENGEVDAQAISQEDRARIKEHITVVMLNAAETPQAQLSQALNIIGESDFPADWQTLLDELTAHMAKLDLGNIVGVLTTVHSLFFKYRRAAKSNEVLYEIQFVMEKFAEPYITLYEQILHMLQADAKNPDPKTLECMELMVEVFYSLTFIEVPQFFVDRLEHIFGSFFGFLGMPFLKQDDPEEAGPVEKLQTACLMVIEMFTDKWDEDAKPYMSQFVQCGWDLLTNVSDEERFDVLVSRAVKFMTSVVRKLWNKELFNNADALQTVCQRVVIPQIKLREADFELFNYNGLDYVRTDLEGSDVDTRRRTSVDFIRGLTVHFNKEVTQILQEHVVSLLAEYKADPANNWVAKDAAMYIIYALSAKSKTERKGVIEVNPYIDILQFFGENVMPELSQVDAQTIDERPIIKADCLRYITAFRNQLPRDKLQDVFGLMVQYLASEQFVVYSYAAVACDKLLGLRAENGAPLVQAEPLEPLLSGLFGCLKKPDSDQNAYVMQCIATVCAQVGSAMQPIRGKMVSMFLELLEAVAQNPTNPAFTHNLFDSLGCVVHTCCSMEGDNSGAIAEFENTLFQPFGAILEMETCEEFAPYVFQIFAQILDLSRSTQLSQNYQTLFPKLLVPSVWESAGNIPAIIPLLGVYLKRGIALNDTQMQGLLGIFQKLNSDPRRAISHFGLDLVSSVFFYSDMQSYQNYVTGVFGWANERLKQKPPKKYISSFILFLSTFIRKFGSVSVLQQVIPQELFMPTLEIWVNNVVTNEMRSMATKKTSIVGLTQVVTCAEYMGNENYAQCFVPGISCILTAFASHLGSTAHSQVLELKTEDSVLHERSFRTAFSKLPSVRLAPLDPYHDVKDMKQHFVQQLAQCVKQNHNLYSALGQLNEQQQASLQQMCSDFSISLSA